MHINHTVYCLDSGRGKTRKISSDRARVSRKCICEKHGTKVFMIWCISQFGHWEGRKVWGNIVIYNYKLFVNSICHGICYEDILNNLTVIFTMPWVYQYSVPSETLQFFADLQWVFDFAWVRISEQHAWERVKDIFWISSATNISGRYLPYCFADR